MPAPELSSSPTDTHCTHVRVGLLLLRGRVRPTLARCYLPPLLPAAHAKGICAALAARRV